MKILFNPEFVNSFTFLSSCENQLLSEDGLYSFSIAEDSAGLS